MKCVIDCYDHCAPKLEKPCRCGGTKFVEPRMRKTNCFPSFCAKRGCCCCCKCRQVQCCCG